MAQAIQSLPGRRNRFDDRHGAGDAGFRANHMQILCGPYLLSLENKRRSGLITTRHGNRPHHRGLARGDDDMQDIYWIALTLGLLAATLGYAALCERA
ncbi:hypothetical protein [Sphingobium olei]|uniref:Uncharacterized protein n=1 Tax=Sphingobium olei TaxID=420955 RepID=A0ABW3NZ58_9SPHN